MNCKNCNTEITSKFCPDCGQPASLKRIDGKYIIHEIEHVLHFERGILFTIKELITNPGQNIKSWGRDSDEVYGTTIHELSHALHSVLDRGSYDNIVRDSFLSTSSQVKNRNRRLLETWPTTVEILLTLDRYKTKFNKPNYKVYQDNNYQDYQNQKIASQNHYTSGGYDMIDNINQRLYYNDSSYPVDRVNGYTIKQLEQALIGARLWTGWRDNIKTKYNNPTEIYLDELFNNWQD